MNEPLIRNVSDTSRWVAMYRAHESERENKPLFQDKFARPLAGERGEQIAADMKEMDRNSWAFVTRTWLIDTIIAAQIRHGADTFINLAAGLDARPYRMDLPPSLRWIEVDLPELTAYKEEVLQNEEPVCRLERVGLDLADVAGRRRLFERVAGNATKAVVISEGLLIYLTPGEVSSLARDLSAHRSFQRWVVDIASPGLMHMLEKQVGKHLEEAQSPLQFAPTAGPDFFIPNGWEATEVFSILKMAARLGRLSLTMRLLALLPESRHEQGGRPWSAVCLLKNLTPAAPDHSTISQPVAR